MAGDAAGGVGGAQLTARRCAIWVDTDALMAAQEVAELAALVEFVVKELHVQEMRGGALRAHAQESGAAPVIPINGARWLSRHRSG